MAEHIETGKLGEDLAALFLERSGYRILDRNVANSHGKRLGEIDIVASRKGEIVFVEVKTMRRGAEEWLPEWNVTRSKLQKLERISNFYLQKHDLLQARTRFDVIAIILEEGRKPQIKHIESAFY